MIVRSTTFKFLTKLFFSVGSLLIGQILLAQNQLFWDYHKPLDIPLSLSGCFGELRTNHFHSGLDFRTQQKTGLSVYAIDEGYVSRIKVSVYGYGKVLYIDHPNGYTSVYAHLDKFADKIEEYVKGLQYLNQTFEIELFPDPYQIKVNKGELVALSGNTGSSGGPHVHFEIRDTKTEEIINPMLFGFDLQVQDQKKPTIVALRAYPLEEQAALNGLQQPSMVTFAQNAAGMITTKTIRAKGKIGLGIQCFDQSNLSYGKNGVYQIKASCNGKTLLEMQFDRFAFDQSRYLNYYLDYEHFTETNNKFQKLFLTNDVLIPMVKKHNNLGWLEIAPNKTYQVKIEVSDFHQNTSVVLVPIVFDATEMPPKKDETKGFVVKKSRDEIFDIGPFEVMIPAKTLYEDTKLDLQYQNGKLKLHHKKVPVHGSITLTFDPEKAGWTPQSYLAYMDNSKPLHEKAELKKNGTRVAYVRRLGNYQILEDKIAPNIQPANFKEGEWLSNKSQLQVKISDQGSGIKTFNAYLNGKWILMEYEYKDNLLFHAFVDGKVQEGKNDLKVVVEDYVGNSTIFETHFFRTNSKP
ncbi:MAG: M23 family metallopeptidase [Flavobacterium sp.]